MRCGQMMKQIGEATEATEWQEKVQNLTLEDDFRRFEKEELKERSLRRGQTLPEIMLWTTLQTLFLESQV